MLISVDRVIRMGMMGDSMGSVAGGNARPGASHRRAFWIIALAIAFVLMLLAAPGRAAAAELAAGTVADDIDQPQVIQAPDQHCYLQLSEGKHTLYPSTVFSDWTVGFVSAKNSNPAIATVVMSKKSNSLAVTPKKAGAIAITCVGMTQMGQQVETTFRINVVNVRLGAKSFTGWSYVTYPGLKATASISGAGKLKWTSSNTSIAKVSKTGKITAGKALGSCTITATAGEFTQVIPVDNTYKSAYKAVKNGFADMGRKLKYSQAKRMEKSYRDCSSFVSRCYWDTTASPARKLRAIGPEWTKSWAGTAASQAQWLNSTKRCVAKKAVATSKLLAGDTIHFQTGYAGLNTEYRHIDHVALYVGGGLYLHTGGFGGKGTVGLGQYWPSDSSIRFIGRPFAQPILSKSQVTLTAKAGKAHSTTLKLDFKKASVKWKSSNPKVAKVSSKGKVTAKRKGTTVIKAISGGRTYTCRVTVK